MNPFAQLQSSQQSSTPAAVTPSSTGKKLTWTERQALAKKQQAEEEGRSRAASFQPAPVANISAGMRAAPILNIPPPPTAPPVPPVTPATATSDDWEEEETNEVPVAPPPPPLPATTRPVVPVISQQEQEPESEFDAPPPPPVRYLTHKKNYAVAYWHV